MKDFKGSAGVTRREFIGIGGVSLGLCLVAGAEPASTFTTITYNVLACQGYPETEANRDALKAVRAEIPRLTGEALKSHGPDLVTLQESPSEAKVAEMAEALGMEYAYFEGGWPGTLMTKHEILERENRPSAGPPHPDHIFTRHLGRAKLDTPLGKLHLVTAHFHPSDHDVRMEEAAAVVALVAQLRETGPVIFQGDLNHKPGTPEYETWTEAGLVDVGQALSIGETPTFSSTKPRTRIDYVWATPDLAKRAVNAEVLNVPPYTPVGSDPTSYGLSDHVPVLAQFGVSQ